MRKFFTLISLAAMGLSLSAADFTVNFKGQPVTDGATYQNGYFAEEWEAGVDYKQDSEVTVSGTPGLNMTIDVTILNQVSMQICAFAGCEQISAANDYHVVKKGDLPSANMQPMDIRLDLVSEDVVPTKDINTKLVFYANNNPTETVTIYVNMLAKPDSEVGSVKGVSTADWVKLGTGKNLTYNVAGTSTLKIFNILGTPVLTKTVSGHGNVSLSNIPAGVYIYRLGNHSAKFVLK